MMPVFPMSRLYSSSPCPGRLTLNSIIAPDEQAGSLHGSLFHPCMDACLNGWMCCRGLWADRNKIPFTIYNAISIPDLHNMFQVVHLLSINTIAIPSPGPRGFWWALTCLLSEGCFLVLTDTLGMKAAAPLHGLWTAALGEAALSENSISQQSGGSCSLIVWKSSFQFWVRGVAVSVRYSLLKNCHITNKASVDPGACSKSQY